MRLYRWLFLMAAFFLMACQTSYANPVTILGASQVEIGQDILVTESYDKKGLKYVFKVKDGAVWREALLLPIDYLGSNKSNEIYKIDVFLDHYMEDKIGKSKDVIAIEKASKIVLGSKECATVTAKMDVSFGVVFNYEMILVPGMDGFKLVNFICADSDTQYWRPIMQKIAANIL